MSRKRFAATLLTAALTGLATTSSAVDTEFGRSGPYLGGGGVYAFENFDINSYSPDDSWGYEVKGGYRFNEWFALEADWNHLLGFDDSQGDTEQFLASVNGKFFPFHGFIQPYALFGVGYSSISDDHVPNVCGSAHNGPCDDETGVGFLFAAGLDVYVHRNFGFYGQAGYLLPNNSDYGAIPVNFGIFYRFF